MWLMHLVIPATEIDEVRLLDLSSKPQETLLSDFCSLRRLDVWQYIVVHRQGHEGSKHAYFSYYDWSRKVFLYASTCQKNKIKTKLERPILNLERIILIVLLTPENVDIAVTWTVSVYPTA